MVSSATIQAYLSLDTISKLNALGWSVKDAVNKGIECSDTHAEILNDKEKLIHAIEKLQAKVLEQADSILLLQIALSKKTEDEKNEKENGNTEGSEGREQA